MIAVVDVVIALAAAAVDTCIVVLLVGWCYSCKGFSCTIVIHFLFLFFQETNAKLIKLLETDFAVPRRDRALTAVAVVGGNEEGGKKVLSIYAKS